MNLYDAMYVRKSVRRFKKEKLDQEILDNIMRFADNLQSLDEKYNVEYKIIENKSGVVPYYFVIGSEDMENHMVNAGYLMCQISLYMTSRGIASCYQGIKNPDLNEIKKLKYPFAVMLAFGKPEKALYRDISKIKRLKYEKVSFCKEKISEDAKKLLKAAVLAPSSFNNQPWRFVAYENRIHIFCAGSRVSSKKISKLKLIDIGNSLAYLLLAAEEMWIDVSVRKIENIAEKNIKRNEYILSVLLR